MQAFHVTLFVCRKKTAEQNALTVKASNLRHLLRTRILHHKDNGEDRTADEIGRAAGLDHKEACNDEKQSLVGAAVIGEEAAERRADGDHAHERGERHHNERKRRRVHHQYDGREYEDIWDNERRDRKF